MICPYCRCETQTPEAHPPGYPACLEVQRLRRQLELAPGGPAFEAHAEYAKRFGGNGCRKTYEYLDRINSFFHDPGEGDNDQR